MDAIDWYAVKYALMSLLFIGFAIRVRLSLPRLLVSAAIACTILLYVFGYDLARVMSNPATVEKWLIGLGDFVLYGLLVEFCRSEYSSPRPPTPKEDLGALIAAVRDNPVNESSWKKAA